MNVLVYLLAAAAFFILAYRFYGRYVAREIGEDKSHPTPAAEINDGKDYVPTRPSVLFAHHYATIAGAGPIVGPTLGILYGIGPAWLWVVIGAIFFGAVHDFTALFASVRERGCSMAEIAKKALGPTGFLLFIVFTIILIVLVTSAFLSLTAISLTSVMPLSDFGLDETQTLLRTEVIDGTTHGVIGGIASSSVIVITLLAPLIGFLVTKRGMKTLWAYVIAAGVCFFSIWVGFQFPVTMSPVGWMIVISIYTLFSCQVPVWVILQPRDFVNVQILYAGMAIMIVGVVMGGLGGLTIDYPVSNMAVGAEKMGPIWPFLFITIACGAISGFHSLVSSGTSAKQVRDETDSLFVGYGSMLMEGALATLVIIAVAAGIGMGYTPKGGAETLTGVAAWTTHYSSWAAAAGLGSKVSAFVDGSANMIVVLGIPKVFALAIMGVFVASFAGTTLDTATRIQRYVIAELAGDLRLNFLTGRYVATAIAVGSALVLAFIAGASGTGALKLWPLFGAVNQTLAALALVIITLYLEKQGGLKWLIAGIPAVFMAFMTIWAVIVNQVKFGVDQNVLLQVINICILFIAIWIVIEGLIKFFRMLGKPPEQPETVTAS